MQKNDAAPLDSFDLKILETYQRDTRIPAEQIGSQVGLSPTAVQRRLKRLREIGVITGEVALLAPAMLDHAVTCVVGVDLEREGATELDRFKARMSACDQVQQCYYVTGDSDFILIVLSRDMAHYELFTRQMLLDDANVQSFTTHVVMDRVKAGMLVPMPGAGGAV
ncbi:MAG: Lrp/AsnC family transcriptional regulator [Betaproteobacteria bacterium]